MTQDRLDHESVKQSLRQLLGMLEPIIRATGNSTNLHGMLTYLEVSEKPILDIIAFFKPKLFFVSSRKLMKVSSTTS